MARKDLRGQIETALSKCRDEASFFRFLLNDTLEWPVSDAQQIEDISFGWSHAELHAAGIEPKLVEGPIWQLQPLENRQPWGIFVLEFRQPDALSHRRGMAGVLRRVLRGLVASRRKDPNRPSWKHEHLLFICTHKWQTFRFAYFRSAPEDSRTPKLKTFGWAPDTQNRTVCEFNLPKLVWPDDPENAQKWVAQWAEAFDKEPLTTDFFKRFDNALEKIQSDLQEYQKLSSAEAYTQSQLLLERMIFLYFLQNRGWLNQERHFLRNKFHEFQTKPDAFTYYREFLDKLFWTLSTPAGSSPGRLPGIPFLNGGLFDDDEFAQPQDQRKTNPPLKVRNSTFKYVFDELLEAFNFTVTEDTPLNQDVAVDPEMLGKVFESIVLHAEQADPDAVAPDKRKATGSYYTPRIVVHFICQEVLYQYLLNHLEGAGWGPRLRAVLAIDTSDGLDDEEKDLLRKTITPDEAKRIFDLVKPLKCCDPAVGSGAFPVGLLHELANLRRVLETAAKGYVDPARGEGYTWLQNTKEDIVQNCLFGVDIQQQAIEICRLRLWLSLVVDYDLGLDPFAAEKTQFNRAIDGISQLPNLEMNFHRGDSLHDHISGIPVVILPEKASRYADGFQKIAKLGDELHHAKRAEKKRRLRVEILAARLDLSERIIKDELKTLDTSASALDTLFHDETESSADKRKRITQEKGRLSEAMGKIGKDRSELEKLANRQYDNQFYVKLRKLEGADFDSPFNFAWYIDFPQIFASKANGARGGFDIVVGNPPFVTARNRQKRELWQQRWPRVCYKNYLLLCPFFELSFSLLKRDGQLGFIVSNAFAKRELGKYLIEDFLTTIELQELVDCSGLMFPGHGTPTCLVFGNNRVPNPHSTVHVVGILPGGGDLRTPPEESSLWQNIEDHHADLEFSNPRIAVSDRQRTEIGKWPWKFVTQTGDTGSDLHTTRLDSYTAEPVGAQFITGKDEAFVQPQHFFRRLGVSQSQIKAYGTGEDVRDWTALPTEWILFPYDNDLRPLKEPLPASVTKYLRPYKETLENSVISGSIKKKETNLKWFEFRRLARAKFKQHFNIIIPQIATHAHFLVFDHKVLFKEKAQAIALRPEFDVLSNHLLAGLLNSAFVLDWLKKECFSKREAEQAETDTYYEFSGGKVEEIPVCDSLSNALSGDWNPLALALANLSKACWERGQKIPALAMRKLFERPNEGYLAWGCRLSGYVAPASEVALPFDSTKGLCETYRQVQVIRDRLLGEMIALQEEMDWLVYSINGLLSDEHPAAQPEPEPRPLEREERPFVLWAKAEGSYENAVKLIPDAWPDRRKKLWEARLAVIRDNEQVRRIEQPVYKRRWDEQWKVGNQWRCGPIAYAAEFVEAFEWWLREKAEWWLENKKDRDTVQIEEWANALWRDSRIQAAWPPAAEQYAFLVNEKACEKAEANGEPTPVPIKPFTDAGGFLREFERIIEDETVPAGFQFAVSYDDLEKKLRKKVPAKLRSVRGKLNVPRERFHRHHDGTYSWAGLQFR
jgi:type I restriction-modification system DNA methylase subunit